MVSRGRPVSEARGRRFARDGGLALALAGIILGASLAFGAVHSWASALVEMLIWLALLASGALREKLQFVPRLFRVGIFLLLGYLAAQSTPLPRAAVAILNPAAEEIYRTTVDPLAGWARDALRPRTAETGTASAEAGDETASLASGWRSISLHPFASRADWLRYVSYAAVLVLAAFCARPSLCMRALIGVGAAVAAVAFLQSATWNGRLLWVFAPYDTGVVPVQTRLTGPFVNADQLASLLQMVLAPGLALLLSYRAENARDRRLPRDLRPRRDHGLGTTLFLILSLTLIIAGLFATASRAGITGGALSLLVLWAFRPPSQRTDSGPRLWQRAQPAVGLAIALASLLYAGPRALQTLDERAANTSWRSDLELRVTMWEETAAMIGDFPVFGVGAGCWRDVITRYRHYPDVYFTPNYAHNDFVEWVAEVGLTGVLLSGIVVIAWLTWVRSNPEIPRVVRAGIFGSLIGVGWHEVFDFSLRSPANACMLAVLAGLACNPRWKRRRDSDERAESRGAGGWLLPVTVTLALLAASAAQFREALLWIRARSGVLEQNFTPANAETSRFLANNLLAAGSGDVTPVVERLRAGLERRPTDAQALRNLSAIAIEPRVKREALEAALFLQPTRGPWRATLAALLDAQGQRDRALTEIETAAYLDPLWVHHPYLDPANHLDPAVFSAVERGFKRVLSEHPGDPWLLYNIGLVYVRFERWEEAAKLFEDGAVADGIWSRFGGLAGFCRAKAGQYAEAQADLERALASAPERAPLYQQLALGVLQPQGKLDEAAQLLQAGIRRADQGALLLLIPLHDIQSARGDRGAALDALSRAGNVSVRDPDFRFRLGVKYLEDGDPWRAGTAFEQAIRLDGKRAVFHSYFALALERRSDFAGARAALKQAVALDPGNPSYTKRLELLERRLTGAPGVG